VVTGDTSERRVTLPPPASAASPHLGKTQPRDEDGGAIVQQNDHDVAGLEST